MIEKKRVVELSKAEMDHASAIPRARRLLEGGEDHHVAARIAPSGHAQPELRL